MKKNALLLFMIICFALCMLPAVWMAAAPSMERIGNERAADPPVIRDEEGQWNPDLLSDLGAYFEQHYAFRPSLITADAAIQAKLFCVSNTDSVVTGRDGWLFYRSTLDDYFGRGQLSSRGLYDLAHNLALLQRYVQSQGADFLFMVPPNKNTLYPQYMPYYLQAPEGAGHNRDHLRAVLQQQGVSYLDLFQLFREQDDILYLKQDSHWNRLGARLVYDRALTELMIPHPDLRDAETSVQPAGEQDLSAMLYPAGAPAEEEVIPFVPATYDYIANPSSSDPVSVEDFRIETVREQGEGSLLMYRDSFANTLLPLFANVFSHGYFSKSVPYTIARDMDLYSPDTVIVELVERNLKSLAQIPPVMPAPERDAGAGALRKAEGVKCLISACQADASYMEFSGAIPKELMKEADNIYLCIKSPARGDVFYEAFTTSTPDTDYGFTAYLPLDLFESPEAAQQAEYEICLGS